MTRSCHLHPFVFTCRPQQGEYVAPEKIEGLNAWHLEFSLEKSESDSPGSLRNFSRSLPPCFALKSPKVQSHFVAQSFVYGDSLKTQPDWHDWWIGLKYPSFCDYFVTTDSLDWYLEPILGLHRSTGIPTALWCRLVAIVVPDPDTAASWAKQREPQKIPTKWADQTIILISFIVRRATKTAMDDQRWP